MSASLVAVAYVAAIILFILSLGGLSSPESSRRGNLYGMIGMAIAVLATISGRVAPSGIARVLGAPAIEQGMMPLVVMSVVALLFGVHMVMAIGGADMPVVVSMLNSYSGWAAAATGFMLSNDLLIVTGALVGSSGAILSYIMCRAMNRNFLSVIAGGFGGEISAPAAGGAKPAGEVVSVNAQETADLLHNAKHVIVV